MRNIAVNLTDDECKKLAELCAAYNITVSALIEKFIKDAIQTRDSDEKLFAERYIERAYSYPDQTLLWHLISNGYDPESDFLSCMLTKKVAEIFIFQYNKQYNHSRLRLLFLLI